MLFHDPIFLFLFLPLTICISLLLRRFSKQEAVVIFLSLASLVFYGYWNPNAIPVLLGSIFFNYFLGQHLSADANQKKARSLLVSGIVANLGLLAGFKYLGMLTETAGFIFGHEISAPKFELPLGISFFTFLQIAYLVDASRGQASETHFPRYFLFVTFFPHLIAGPLVHHRELMPQFVRNLGHVWENLAIGLTIFGIGLFKKLVLADHVGTWYDSLFNGAAAGIVPSLIDSWVGALSFSLVIYFDFSAYSDMAIGLSKIFGIRLPENFNSPYKATSIIDFWRRWHMTLSRFLRDYLYVPLGGNRCGQIRRYLNLMLVMLLAGLWHGASWKFVVWGGQHGIYLLINHSWRKVTSVRLYKPLCIGITFLAVTFAWVPFRADTFQTAMTVFEGMVGLHGVILPAHYREVLPYSLSLWMISHGVTFGATLVYGGGTQLVILGVLMMIVWFLPNTHQIATDFKHTLGSDAPLVTRPLRWKPAGSFAIGMGIVGAYLMLLATQGKAGEFIYFQF